MISSYLIFFWNELNSKLILNKISSSWRQQDIDVEQDSVVARSGSEPALVLHRPGHREDHHRRVADTKAQLPRLLPLAWYGSFCIIYYTVFVNVQWYKEAVAADLLILLLTGRKMDFFFLVKQKNAAIPNEFCIPISILGTAKIYLCNN